MINVKKSDGKLIPYNYRKIFKICQKMNLSRKESENVIFEIEKNIYDGIPTEKIIQMILNYGKKHKPYFKNIINLRESLGKINSYPDFEQYISILFRSLGYKTINNKIIKGNCVNHEIDIIALKEDEVIYVEIKHHNKFHTFTGLNVLLSINSTFEDLIEGYKNGKNKYNFNKGMIVCNTKISKHALNYSSCKNIGVLCWGHPKHNGIEVLIKNNSLYPITILKDLKKENYDLLTNYGIYTLKELIESNQKKILKESRISEKELNILINKAKEFLEY